MRSVIQQTVLLPASAHDLFEMYIDPALHAAITGAPVTIDAVAGSSFQAFDGSLTGTILSVVAPRLIVQSWRSENFLPRDPDSTLFLTFGTYSGEGRIDLVHLDVPTQDFDGVRDGWRVYYWEPWRAYLGRR
jgi:activator of HSP90 ATPase